MNIGPTLLNLCLVLIEKTINSGLDKKGPNCVSKSGEGFSTHNQVLEYYNHKTSFW